MPRRVSEDDEWDDEDEADEDGPEDDDAETVACPHCNRQIYEDAERCPYCEQYISKEDAPRSRKSWLIIVGTLLCLYAIYHWIVG